MKFGKNMEVLLLAGLCVTNHCGIVIVYLLHNTVKKKSLTVFCLALNPPLTLQKDTHTMETMETST